MTQQKQYFDLLVVGGGINGVAIASDAAGRGLNVALVEMSDLASATSSASSKLIHGGLRYLEHYEFRLVGEALAERETLLKNAPHLVAPLRFRLPHRPHLRPAWMIRAGLFLYDNLGKRVSLPASKGIRFTANDPLKSDMVTGFEYSDCAVDDARLVVCNALLAKQKGATILTRTRCTQATAGDDGWTVTVQDDKSSYQIQSKALVNAAGPWVESLFSEQLDKPAPRSIRLVKGSHIVVPKLYKDDHAYILQNEDKRIVFVIPYQQDYSMIGTTDVDYEGDPSKVAISDDEVEYLCDIVNQHFKSPISPSDVINTWSGVRPLMEDESSDAQAVTRDYTIEVDGSNPNAPLLSVFGGKLTTYRKLGQAAMKRLQPFFPDMSGDWTENALLPGGDFPSREHLEAKIARYAPTIDIKLIKRWVRNYGTRTHQMLDGLTTENELGLHFGHGLYQAEVDYLVEHEWAISVEDILWRRTKLGLAFNTEQTEGLYQYINNDSQALRA